MAPTAEPPAAPTGDADGDDVPNVIKALRDDFKAERARRQAAEAAQQQYLEAMAKGLGYTPETTPTDPAQLSQELSAERIAAKEARVALAVFRNASAAGGDPAALLDSAAFLTKVAALDPSDEAAITAAIQKAVTDNPQRLGAAPADPRTPAPNPAQGSSANGAPDLDSQIAAAQAAKNTRLAIHLQNQKLAPPARA